MSQKIVTAALAAATLLGCVDAWAVAQRTFVSTSGNDANTASNCSLVSPCRSFGVAMTVTAANGEIVALNSGGYGRVTIDRSVSIVAPPGVYAGISVFSGENGVDIATDGVDVLLRGLTINGQGGMNGVNVNALNVRLRVEGCAIANLTGGSSYGMNIHNTGGDLAVVDTVIRNNTFGMAVIGGHVLLSRLQVEGSASNGIALADVQAAISASTITGNGNYGLRVDSGAAGETIVAGSDSSITGNGSDGVAAYTSGATGVRLALARTTIATNGQSGVVAFPGGTGAMHIEVTDSTVKSNTFHGFVILRLGGSGTSVLTAAGNLISSNNGRGILASGAAVTAIASRNTITMNTNVGLEQSTSAVFESSTDNVVRGNNAGGVQTTGAITGIGGT